MNLHWKIFKIANLICLALITIFFIWPIITQPALTSKIRNYFYAIIILINATAIINCVLNISLVNILVSGERLTLKRKILFWIFLVLFAATVLLFGYGFCHELLRILNYKTGGYKPHISWWNLMIPLFISITGIYVIIVQIVIFFKKESAYRKSLDQFIDEIGS